MTKSKIVCLFISLYLVRFYFYQSPLPPDWSPSSSVRYVTRITEKPEYSDSKTIVRSGRWYLPVTGYKSVIPGSLVSFEGMVEPKLILGKVTRIKVIDPKLTIISENGAPLPIQMMVWLLNWRENWVSKLQKNLPEPMASLSAGILLGVKASMLQDFYQELVQTGTLHIVAASGYNVMIVGGVVIGALSRWISRGAAIFVGIVSIVGYIVIAGGSASVVRAGIMGSLSLMAYYFGRVAEAKRLLWVTAGIMLLFDPLLVFDVSFQLSLSATAGLLYLEPIIPRWWTDKKGVIQIMLAEYLYPTLAATISTLPVILYHFGRVSYISPLVNILILPAVPLIMLLSAVAVLGGQLFAWIAYVPLAYVVYIIQLLGKS